MLAGWHFGKCYCSDFPWRLVPGPELKRIGPLMAHMKHKYGLALHTVPFLEERDGWPGLAWTHPLNEETRHQPGRPGFHLQLCVRKKSQLALCGG